MLSELSINNFLFISLSRLEFNPGFTVITGETGAGKTILLQAIGLLVGERGSPDLISQGCDSAKVEGIFNLEFIPKADVLKKWLEEWDLTGDNNELIIRRVLQRSGTSRAYINGAAVKLKDLQYLGDMLFDFHGQHEHQSLLNPEVYLDLIDAYGKLEDQRHKVSKAYSETSKLMKEKEALLKEEQRLRQEEDFIRFQLKEIESANLKPAEEEELKLERSLLSQVENLREAGERATNALDGENGLGAISLVENAIEAVMEISKIDPGLEEIQKELEPIPIILSEAAKTLQKYKSKIESDPIRLESIEERLAFIQRLKKKYGGSLEEVIEFGLNLKEKLESLENSDLKIQEITKSASESFENLQKSANKLSQGRKKVAKNLAPLVKAELMELGFSHVEFHVHVEKGSDAALSEFTKTGIDKVEFSFSANPGSAAKPLRQIASGGEISRVMLALKSILAEVDQVSALLFDEIDLGIGGVTAEVVGEKLKKVSKSRQLICITHLPQIASRSENHMMVRKIVKSGKTLTEIIPLDQEGRKAELARMLGRTEADSASQFYAEELLNSSKTTKKHK